MNLVSLETFACAVCQKMAQYQVLTSSERSGWPDLDLRPPEALRSTLAVWVQRCPHCGYVNEQIRLLERPEVRGWVNSPEYQRVLEDEAWPPLARNFRARALLAERSGDAKAAFFHHLYAAWVCDDANEADRARDARVRSAEFLRPVVGEGETHNPRLILIDLLRRSGQFGAALEACAQLEGLAPDAETLRQVGFQRELIGRQDEGAHTQGEVFTSA